MQKFLETLANVRDTDPMAHQLRAKTLCFLCLAFIVITAVVSALSIHEYGWSSKRLTGPSAIALYIVVLALLNRTRSMVWAGGVFMTGLVAANSAFVSVTGGPESYALPFLIAIPLSAAFLMGRRGLIAFAAIAIAAAALIIGPNTWGEDAFFARMQLTMMVICIISISIISYGFSWIHEAQARKLSELNKKLDRSREAAEAANVAKSRFVANMSHEVRSPLNGVLGMAQALSAEDLDAKQRDCVDVILESGRTLMSVVDDVLDLSKIEAAKMEIAPTRGDLSHGLRRLVKLWTPKADARGLALTLEIAPDFPATAIYDAVRVSQCVSNLVSNALKFTSTGGVHVRAETTENASGDHLVSIAVSDTGVGISEAVQVRLFTAFEQADGGTARRFGGTGLGLAITRNLARLMDGDVTVTSRQGVGSTFTLTFRAQADAAPAATPPPPPPLSGPAPTALAGLRLLIVDDSKINRMVARALLASYEMVIEEAEDGNAALRRIADGEDFDLMFLDVHMPGLDGPATLQRLRNEHPVWRARPVIALTADAMAGDRERYTAMGMDGYIAKPIDGAALIDEMMRVLARRDLRGGSAAA